MEMLDGSVSYIFMMRIVKMWKNILLFFSIIAMCYCEDNYNNLSKPHRKPYYDPYYGLFYGGGLLYYITFILIKIKVVFVLGTIFTVILFAGKLFAIIKYADYLKTPKAKEPEKIYIQAPDHGHFHDHDSFPGPGYHSDSINFQSPQYDSPYSSPYSSGITVDKLPPNAEIAGGQNYDSPPSHRYGRNYRYDVSLYEYYNLFMKTVRRINLTEIIFNYMKVKSNDCRRKFVCKADYNAKYSAILSSGLELWRDKNYDRYKTNTTITSLDQCNHLYPKCTDINME